MGYYSSNSISNSSSKYAYDPHGLEKDMIQVKKTRDRFRQDILNVMDSTYKVDSEFVSRNLDREEKIDIMVDILYKIRTGKSREDK